MEVRVKLSADDVKEAIKAYVDKKVEAYYSHTLVYGMMVYDTDSSGNATAEVYYEVKAKEVE